LLTNFYQNYGIKPGNLLHCRIDKINCSGRVFLEPEHPFYQVGKQYVFKVFEKFSKADQKGRMIEYFKLTGPNFENLTAICTEEISGELPVNIMANLVRIKKGVLIISELHVINNC